MKERKGLLVRMLDTPSWLDQRVAERRRRKQERPVLVRCRQCGRRVFETSARVRDGAQFCSIDCLVKYEKHDTEIKK